MARSDPDWLFLVPGDPGQRTGGYGYVREVVAGLQRLGQRVSLRGLPGRFPAVDRLARESLEAVLSGTPEGATVVVDGLALCGCPEAAERHGRRLNLIALVHHPLADETGLGETEQTHLFATERRTLAAVRRVITTSATTAEGLARYQVPRDRIAVVTPGVHPVAPAGQGDHAPDESVRVLCLAHLSPRKAQLDLVEALARIRELPWSCELAGALDRDRAYADTVIRSIASLGLNARIQVPGELSGPALTQAFSRADLFVLPSLYEGYGMVIDEALAHGLPVIASDGGALAVTAWRPGCVTYPAGDVAALTGLLAEYLQDRHQLDQQRRQARASAEGLRSWDQCAEQFLLALSDGPVALPEGTGFDARWLSLREPADHAARARDLDAQAVRWLDQQADRPLVIADIGSGSGSNWRYLGRALPASIISQTVWHLYDQDPRLLARLGEQPGVRLHAKRLESTDLDQALPPHLDLLTASALIDLVSRPWLQALAGSVARRRAAVLVVLSYAGRFRLTPAHRADDDLKALVNEHQHGDKGTGAACGPEAAGILRAALEEKGYGVQQAPSNWHLDTRHTELMVALMEGWVEAARAQLHRADGDAPSGWLDQWLLERINQARQGTLAIEVAHTDLFGVPAP